MFPQNISTQMSLETKPVNYILFLTSHKHTRTHRHVYTTIALTQCPSIRPHKDFTDSTSMEDMLCFSNKHVTVLFRQTEINFNKFLRQRSQLVQRFYYLVPINREQVLECLGVPVLLIGKHKAQNALNMLHA